MDYIAGAVFFLVVLSYVAYAVKTGIESDRYHRTWAEKQSRLEEAKKAAWQRLSDCSQMP